ncbi:hypothetical protein P8C59_007026 [Phyllachora maydis]|uniref:Uncharacterized protein n=1 Tax=Phyllachora maydis TaxID=1825666 RepID=A0AAD9I808_9PEZI|nr:hypothetical protein P8C59_007026 [Phyllachora maydis]
MADQAKGKGIAPKRASNLADPGQSSRPLPPIRTLSEDKEDSKDYSEVIEVLKHLNTLKASVEDSVSAIKNISSTLASLTNSSNAAATGKTSYSPRFDSFSGTMDLDSPLRPPRKEPYLGPAIDNTATSNLDPPIDTGSKEGFKDTITSSIVKELSKKAYTIPDDKNPNISNTYSDSDQAVLLMLLRNSLSSSPKAAISNPAIEAYRVAYIANSSNSTPNSNSNPSKKGKNKKKGKKKASYNVKGQNYSAKSAEQASFMLGSYNLAIEEEEESDSSSNSNFKKLGFFLNIKGSSKPILHANFAFPLGLSSYTTKSIEPQRNKIVVEIPSNSIRKEDYRPIIEDAMPTNNTALKGELVDLDLDLEEAVSPDPSNFNTEKPISIEIGPSKLEPYESSSDSELDKPSPDKPINPVIVESTKPTISIRKTELLEAFP